MEVTLDQARKVLETVDCGLSSGLGNQKPGEMCVEAAVCFALGLPHGDDPPCVSPAVRAFKIRLNDSRWSGPVARASGLRKLAIAQLGSNMVDDSVFAAKITEQTIRQILPLIFRRVAKLIPSEVLRLNLAADTCEREGTARAADGAARAASAARDAADAADAARVASAAARAADAAADGADAAADGAAGDEILTLQADIAVDILRDMNAPGIVLMDQLIQG